MEAGNLLVFRLPTAVIGEMLSYWAAAMSVRWWASAQNKCFDAKKGALGPGKLKIGKIKWEIILKCRNWYIRRSIYTACCFPPTRWDTPLRAICAVRIIALTDPPWCSFMCCSWRPTLARGNFLPCTIVNVLAKTLLTHNAPVFRVMSTGSTRNCTQRWKRRRTWTITKNVVL